MDLINYFQYNSILILSFFFISFLELVIDKLTNGLVDKYLFSVKRGSILNPLTYIRLFSHSIGHSSWSHFSHNFLYILLVGPMIEEKYGTIDLLIMMLITSFVVGVINNLTTSSSLRGASDIVFMFVVLSSFVNLESGKIPLTLVLIFIFYIVDEIIDLKENKKDNVSHAGHLIGAICGAVFGFLYMNGFSFTAFFSSLLK